MSMINRHVVCREKKNKDRQRGEKEREEVRKYVRNDIKI